MAKHRARNILRTLLPAAVLASYMIAGPREAEATPPSPISAWSQDLRHHESGEPFDLDPQMVFVYLSGDATSPVDTLWTGQDNVGEPVDPNMYSAFLRNDRDGLSLDGQDVRFKWGPNRLPVKIDVDGEYHTVVTLDGSAPYMELDLRFHTTPVSVVPDLEHRLDMSVAPNPSNPITTVYFTLPEQTKVNLDIYDIRGRHIDSLLQQEALSKGPQSVTWHGKNEDGQSVASGVYHAVLRTEDGYRQTERLTVVR